MGSFCLDWCWLTKIRLRKSFCLAFILKPAVLCDVNWRESSWFDSWKNQRMEKSPSIIPWRKTLEIIYWGNLFFLTGPCSKICSLLWPWNVSCRAYEAEKENTHTFSVFSTQKVKVFVSNEILLGHLDQKITTVENKQEKQSFDILKELCSSSPQHIIPTKKHVTSITLVSNNFTASLRFLFKQLKAKVLCMFFLELGSVVLSSSRLNRLLALKLQWWEFSPRQALGKSIGLYQRIGVS